MVFGLLVLALRSGRLWVFSWFVRVCLVGYLASEGSGFGDFVFTVYLDFAYVMFFLLFVFDCGDVYSCWVASYVGFCCDYLN